MLKIATQNRDYLHVTILKLDRLKGTYETRHIRTEKNIVFAHTPVKIFD